MVRSFVGGPGRTGLEKTMEILIIITMIAALIALDVLALRFGADSRDLMKHREAEQRAQI